jgi:septal ring factor EnvC (AmiA/AmiB activator)
MNNGTTGVVKDPIRTASTELRPEVMFSIEGLTNNFKDSGVQPQASLGGTQLTTELSKAKDDIISLLKEIREEERRHNETKAQLRDLKIATADVMKELAFLSEGLKKETTIKNGLLAILTELVRLNAIDTTVIASDAKLSKALEILLQAVKSVNDLEVSEDEDEDKDRK